MSEHLPNPTSGSSQYERPNQKWVCGWAADGHSCQIGPSTHGACRATFECQPALVTKEGETKGRYTCTRSKEFGGPCDFGPLPDGNCRRRIPKCAPVRSIRSKRGALTVAVVGFTVGAMLLIFEGPARLPFISPGELSTRHSNIAIHGHKLLTVSESGGPETCAACHDNASQKPLGWTQNAMATTPNPFQVRRLLAVSETDMTQVDLACQQCHVKHNFHQPDVVQNHSCSSCHKEHMGSGRMKAPADEGCLSCHGSSSVMAAAAQKSQKMDSAAFAFRADLGRQIFKPPHPALGYTKVIHSFATDHPEFDIIAMNLKETNTLKFNHQRHFAADIPAINGKKLECEFCHKDDPPGDYRLPITYDTHCKACHSLQFDMNNPDLVVPHGDPVTVRAFLHSLPVQYADLATRARHITTDNGITTFVNEQMQGMRRQVPTGEELEHKVFYDDDKSGRMTPGGPAGTTIRVGFSGCVHCHELTPNGDGPPIVTKPIIPDRWMIAANFTHAKHTRVACLRCHEVLRSHDTADINLPSKSICVTCHSPQGGADSSCVTCHNFHPKDVVVTLR